MRRAIIAGLLALLPTGVVAATAQNPAVIELFTSQGCSSCPPANANLRVLADRPDVLALSFNVTYWDYLGWKDTFAQAAFTQRQRDYEGPLGEHGPYTPQMVVDGKFETVGDSRAEIEKLIARSDRKIEPTLTLTADHVAIGTGAPGAATVWLVRYDPRTIAVPVGRGENAGVTLPHRNVVRALTNLGEWHGASAQFALPPAPAGLKTAILIQNGTGGEIIAVARD
jgi:hypothetical protein